ncbi:MAG: polysaccharide export protein [Undibacterium sp.]|nr:polysaccharide export protein [Opitutaceae bacterium]
MMTKTVLRFFGYFCAIAATATMTHTAVAAEQSSQPKLDVRANYVLQPSDVIKVQVFQEDDLTREMRLSQESTISLPMINTVNLKGKTLAEAQELIRSLYDRDYLVNPQVTIIILDYSKRSVNVLGSVNTPGVILFPQETGLTLLDAIARAGGFSRLADKKRVRLTRVTADGDTKNYTINADEIMQGATSESWVLLKDDVISVPERVL